MRKPIIRGTHTSHQRLSTKPSSTKPSSTKPVLPSGAINESHALDAIELVTQSGAINEAHALDAIELVTHSPHAPKAALT